MSWRGLDYYASVHGFGRIAVRRRGAASAVPILMYHSVSSAASGWLRGYYDTHVTPARFREHLRVLSDGGWRSISLGEAADVVAGRAPGERVCVLTFDDGYRDFLTDAYPALKEFGVAATVFLPTELIGSPRRQLAGRECLTWEEVAQLASAGVAFGSHTATHPRLIDLADERVAEELRRSARTLDERLGPAARFFAYPYAFPDTHRRFKRMLRGQLEASGYAGGVTTAIGTARPGDDVFFLKRLPVNERDDAALLEAKLSGGYDWLRPFQLAAKLVKHAKRSTPW